MAATYTARTFGEVEQYQLSGTTTAASITPFDSGTVLGTVPPGKAGIKQISGVIQRAADLTVGIAGTNEPKNFLESTAVASGVPTVNAAQLASAGVSLAPEHE
jgi:hypothetical protein